MFSSTIVLVVCTNSVSGLRLSGVFFTASFCACFFFGSKYDFQDLKTGKRPMLAWCNNIKHIYYYVSLSVRTQRPTSPHLYELPCSCVQRVSVGVTIVSSIHFRTYTWVSHLPLTNRLVEKFRWYPLKHFTNHTVAIAFGTVKRKEKESMLRLYNSPKSPKGER